MRIKFEEKKSFYEKIDKEIRNNGTVIIYFTDKKPDAKSKLWPRLMQCKNSLLLVEEFKKIQKRQESSVKSIISSDMSASLTLGGLWLIAWIATLVASVIMYSIYKGRNVKFKTDIDKNIELEIS